MDMIGRIRRLRSRKKRSEREISRMTGLSRNTVAKWLHGEVDGPPTYRRGEQPGKLTVFHEALKQALKADARRPKHERRTAKVQPSTPSSRWPSNSAMRTSSTGANKAWWWAASTTGCRSGT